MLKKNRPPALGRRHTQKAKPLHLMDLVGLKNEMNSILRRYTAHGDIKELRNPDARQRFEELLRRYKLLSNRPAR